MVLNSNENIIIYAIYFVTNFDSLLAAQADIPWALVRDLVKALADRRG